MRTTKTYRKSLNPHSITTQQMAIIESLESRQMLAADLVATYFDVSGGPLLHTGDSQGAAVTVKNQNIIWFLDDAGPFVVRVFISDDPTITTSDTPLCNASFAGLGAGQSSTFSFNCPRTPPGSFTCPGHESTIPLEVPP